MISLSGDAQFTSSIVLLPPAPVESYPDGKRDPTVVFLWDSLQIIQAQFHWSTTLPPVPSPHNTTLSPTIWFATVGTNPEDLPDFNSDEWNKLFGDSLYQYVLHDEDDNHVDAIQPPPAVTQRHTRVTRAQQQNVPAEPLPVLPPTMPSPTINNGTTTVETPVAPIGPPPSFGTPVPPPLPPSATLPTNSPRSTLIPSIPSPPSSQRVNHDIPSMSSPSNLPFLPSPTRYSSPPAICSSPPTATVPPPGPTVPVTTVPLTTSSTKRPPPRRSTRLCQQRTITSYNVPGEPTTAVPTGLTTYTWCNNCDSWPTTATTANDNFVTTTFPAVLSCGNEFSDSWIQHVYYQSTDSSTTLGAFKASNSDPDTLTWDQAMTILDERPKWLEAAAKEIADLEEHQTWVEVPIKDAVGKVLPGMWVFRRKRNLADGTVKRFKGRYTVRGDLEDKSPDDDVFSPVCQWYSIRLILILSLILGWPTCSIDFKNAFVQSTLDSPVWIHLPRGFRSSRHGKTCLRLKRSLYGLCRAPQLWFEYC